MKTRMEYVVAAFAILLFGSTSIFAIEKSNAGHASLRNEVQHAIDKGISWLGKNQNTNGWWSTEDQPAVTALALLALKGEPSGQSAKNESIALQRGYHFLEGSVHEDGSIYRKKELLTHNTALSLLAFASARDAKYDTTMRKARAFLIGLQTDFDEKGKIDNVFDGGVGYGSKYDHSDMANTASALEALYYTKQLAHDKGWDDAKDLNWDAAIHFLQNCQHVTRYNKQPWVSEDEENKGGFVYYPGHSMAGETNINGRTALRAYGSTSYAGLLSFVYAHVKRDDPRMQAVMDWLRRNYTLDENPGMGPQGLFYYFQMMTKALTICGIDELETSNGQKVDWRKELALKLINLQQADGSWANENNRWWEKDPALVTSYAVISLEMIYRGL